MPGLTGGLQIGLSGLSANQSALDVIGHNIANVNTPGYSRQNVNLSTNPANTFGGIIYGDGVRLSGIQGIRDGLLNQQLTQALSLQSGAQARYASLQTVGSVFNDDGKTGLNTELNAFFTAWQRLSAYPEDTAIRQNLLGTAQNLVSGLQSRFQVLQSAQQAADGQVAALVPQINSIAEQIAALNRKLAGQANPEQDNDAIDQRQALADKLAKMIGVQIYTDPDQTMHINLDKGSAPLVGGSAAFTLVAVPDPANATYPNALRVEVMTSPTAVPIDVTGLITGGELGAALDLRDSVLPGYMQDLNEYAAGLQRNVNTLSRSGFDLNGVAGGNFFTGAATPPYLPGSVAAGTPANFTNYLGMVMNMSVDASVLASPSRIAASGTTASGDNSVAQAIVALQNSANLVDTTGGGWPGSSGTFSAFLGGLSNTIGTDMQGFSNTSSTQENIATALQTQRTSKSGVDLDEEAAALIAYQRAYQASARFVNVISTLTDQLVNQLAR